MKSLFGFRKRCTPKSRFKFIYCGNICEITFCLRCIYCKQKCKLILVWPQVYEIIRDLQGFTRLILAIGIYRQEARYGNYR